MKLSKISKTDAILFREATGSVRPLKPDDTHRDPSSRKTEIRKTRRSGPPGHDQGKRSHAGEYNEDEAGQPLSFLRNGFPRKLMKKMGSRDFPVEDSFDLHGMREAEARKALAGFIDHAIADKLACVRVVHGKGLRSDGPPVLKLMTWKLLRGYPETLALKPCAPTDGGTGAVLVLLQSGRRTAS